MTTYESNAVPRSALLFMAAVEEARASNEGAFRAIAPLFRVALEGQQGQLFNVSKAASVLNPILGDNFSDHALEAFVPQLKEIGWLIEETASNAAVYRVPTSLPLLNDETTLEASDAKLSRLYIEFLSYVADHAPLLALTIDELSFKWQLFRWATSLDGSDKDAIKSEAGRLLEGGKPSVKSLIFDEAAHFSEIDKSLSVELAGFTKWLVKNKRAELADIAALTELGLALEFLEELREPRLHKGEQLNLVLVLDAPVLLDLMGLSGEARQTSIESCLKALRDHGAKITTLTHCLEELSEILNTVLDRPMHRRYGLTGDAIRAKPSLASRARHIARSPDVEVKRLGVEVLMIDPRSPLNATYFTDQLIDRFRIAATWHGIDKDEQRYRDALSVAFVMRRRQGRTSSDALSSNYLLITRNSMFTQYADVFVRANLKPPTYSFGPAIETKTLAAIAWMRFGTSAARNLPQIHLISACDRILASNGFLLRRAERRLTESQGADVSAAILSSQQAVLDLVISVGGSPDVLNAADGEGLLQAVTTSAQEFGRQQERALAEAEKGVLTDALTVKSEEVAAERERLLALAAEKVIAEGVIRAREAAIDDMVARDENRIRDTAEAFYSDSKKSAWIFIGSLWAALTAIGVFGQFFIWRDVDWWMRSKENFLLGLTIIASTLLAALFSLRLVPPGTIDVVGALHSSLTKKLLRFKLARVPLVEERNRLIERLEADDILR